MRESKGVSIEKLNEYLELDPETGTLTWRHIEGDTKWNARFAGKQAFVSLGNRGYLVGGFRGKLFQAHHVVFAIYNGYWPKILDHENGDKKDNRPNNLREVSQKDNTRNSSLRKDNKSGVPGVIFSSSRGSWLARITVDGKRLHLGSFKSHACACAARKIAESKYGFHKNHGRK